VDTSFRYQKIASSGDPLQICRRISSCSPKERYSNKSSTEDIAQSEIDLEELTLMQAMMIDHRSARVKED
jgi:hypothetical protein